jgi:hypothetical protein
MGYKAKALLVGALVGAAIGALLAWTAADGHDEAEEGHPLSVLGPADYFQLAISVLTLARQFGGMLKRVQ